MLETGFGAVYHFEKYKAGLAETGMTAVFNLRSTSPGPPFNLVVKIQTDTIPDSEAG